MERMIGSAAGKVWQVLSKASMPMGQLPRAAGLSIDAANQAVGWLAREGKLASEMTVRGRVLKLKR